MKIPQEHVFPNRHYEHNLSGIHDMVPKTRCGHLACGSYCNLEPETDLCTSMFIQRQDDDTQKITKLPTLHENFDPQYLEANSKLKFLKSCSPEELMEELKKNPRFLLEKVCLGLQMLDKTKRGITKISYLNRVLRHLGAVPPMKEISDVLDYCIFTKDNFVVYKPLLLHVFPEKNLHYKDHLKDHFCPTDIYEADIYKPAVKNKKFEETEEVKVTKAHIKRSLPTTTNDLPAWKAILKQSALNSCELTSEKSYYIRQLYAMWDRNLINDEALIYHIQMLGIAVPQEWLNLVSNHSPTRDLSFSKFLQALQINNLHCYRRNRSLAPFLASFIKQEDSKNLCALQSEQINPITWKNESKSMKDIKRNPSLNEIIRNATMDLKEGRTHPTVVKYYFDSLGIKITPQIEKLLNEEELNGSVSYNKILRCINSSINSN